MIHRHPRPNIHRHCLFLVWASSNSGVLMPLPSCGEARVFLLLLCRRQSFGGGGGSWMGFILVFSCFSGDLSQSTVDKLIKKTNLALVVGTNSWRDQFMEAITVSAGM